MKKLLSLLAVVTIALQLSAAPVDVATAQKTAQQYLSKTLYAGKYMAPAATKTELVYTEMGEVNKTTPVFYIFNTATTYLIVSGDDRAEEVLAYGDKPLNINRIPTGLRDMMNIYKHEIDWLISNPTAKVNKPTTYKSPKIRAGETYGPLLTALWDQTAPYWNQCKFTYNGSQYQCLTGCPATSASMVLYYWKWPNYQIDAIPSYTAELDLSYSNVVDNFNYPALPAVTFDWDNMKDSYSGSYSTAQGNAVATLMRYVGQAEHMMYGTESAGGSGIYTSDTQNIVDMYVLFGYDEETCQVVNKNSYSEANWAALVQNEMIEGRPVVYTAVSGGWFGGGHAFNVDGYNSSTNKYHVNFGWSGDGNNWLSMNSFSDGAGSTYNQDQQMVMGIQPAVVGPKISVDNSSLSFNCKAGETKTATFVVTGINLEDGIALTANDANNVFDIDVTNISIDDATAGKLVTVTFAPLDAATFNGTITLTSTNAKTITVNLTGKGTKGTLPNPVLNAATNVTNNSFDISWVLESLANVTYNLSVSTNTGSIVANVTDIAQNNYTVTGLTAGATYICAVKAMPVNPASFNASAWSNRVTITLPTGPALEEGDVNGDGKVDVEDMNIIINIILETDKAENYTTKTDLTNDGKVDVEDMNVIITKILAQQ